MGTAKTLDNCDDTDLELLRLRKKFRTQEAFTEFLMRGFDVHYDNQEQAKAQAELVPLLDVCGDIEKLNAERKRIAGVRTGYWVIDKMSSGIISTDLVVVSAQTSGRKTLFCNNMVARQLLLGYKVVFVSMEMSPASIALRLRDIMQDSAVFNTVVRTDNLLVQKTRLLPYSAMKYVMQNAKTWGADIVYVDHLHYFDVDDENIAHQLGKMAKGMKQLAMDFEIPIVLIAQMRKVQEGKRPSSEDILGSVQINQADDLCFILDRDWECPKDNVRIRVEKNRERANFWQVYSEMTFLKTGFDIEEPEYSETLDARWSYGGIPKKLEAETIRFRDDVNYP